MTLDIEVKGRPASLDAAAHGLSGLARAVEKAATGARSAAGHSGDVWHGHAGRGFREAMDVAVPRIEDLSDRLADVSKALREHADALEGVIKTMHEAATDAGHAGLRVTATEIFPPGPTAGPNGPAGPAGSGSQAARQAAAFEHAGELVASARRHERSAQRRVLRSLKAHVEGMRPFSMADIVPGMTGALLAEPPSQYNGVTDRSVAQSRWDVGFGDFECPSDQPLFGQGRPNGEIWDDIGTSFDLARASFGPNPAAAGALIGAQDSAKKGVDALPGVCLPNLPPDPGDIHPPPPPPPAVPAGDSPDSGPSGFEKGAVDVINFLAKPGEAVEDGLNSLGENLPSPGDGGPVPAPPPVPPILAP